MSPVETSMLTFVALYKLSDGFEHVVDGALETKEVTVPLLLSWFCAAPEPEIWAAMRAAGRLTCSGLVQRNRGGRHKLLSPVILWRICSVMPQGMRFWQTRMRLLAEDLAARVR